MRSKTSYFNKTVFWKKYYAFLACLVDLYDIAAMYGSSAAVSEFRDFL